MTERDDTPPYGSTAVGAGQHTDPRYTAAPIALRRPDAVAALLLLLAGIAAAISLLLPWPSGPEEDGLDLVRRGLDPFGSGIGNGFGDVLDTGMWQPLAIVFGGGLLFLLGLLMLVPARTHRLLGVLALLVGLAAAVAVLVPLIDAGWDAGEFDLGFWFAAAVPALGLLGGAKAVLTGPTHGGRR